MDESLPLTAEENGHTSLPRIDLSSQPSSSFHPSLVVVDQNIPTTTNNEKIITADDIQWWEHLANLCLFKSRNGNCNVPLKFSENSTLASWVHSQRSEYERVKSGQFSLMTSERLMALEGIGFVWEIGRRCEWRVHYEELKWFRTRNGHSLIPTKYPDNPALGSWVSYQREEFKHMREGKPSTMTIERIRKLETINFVFRVGSGGDIDRWQDNYDQLVRFKEEQGHSRVSRMSDFKLWNFIRSQRHQYRLRGLGKRSTLSKDRIHALERIEFEWVVETGKTNDDVTWNRRFQSLKQFKLVNGQVSSFTGSPDIRRWVNTQKRNYRLMMSGKRSPLTQRRIQALEEIGIILVFKNEGENKNLVSLDGSKEEVG